MAESFRSQSQVNRLVEKESKYHLLLERIYNELYLKDGKYDIDKDWNASIALNIAQIIDEYKPRPGAIDTVTP